TVFVAGPALLLLWLVEWICLEPNVGPHLLPKWFEMDRDVAEQAIAFTWARAPGVVPVMLFAAYRSWFYAYHMTRPIIVMTIVANVANAILDYLFVFGDGGLVRLGLPPIGLHAGGVAAAGAVTSAVNI